MTTIHPDIQLDNDLQEHRQALIEELGAGGLDAYEYHSGGGLTHVVVDLVNEEGANSLLQIATGSITSPCDVALMGWNENGDVQSPDWQPVETLGEAIRTIQTLWAKREQWIVWFEHGDLGVRTIYDASDSIKSDGR